MSLLLNRTPVLALLLAPSLAWGVGANIELIEPGADSEPGFHLRIEDRWPTACTPELARVEVRGPEIWVIARDSGEQRFCSQVASSYVIDTRSRSDGELRLREAGLKHVHFAVESRAGLRLRGFALMPIGEQTAPAAAPESGYWWADPSGDLSYVGPGIGLNLERQGGIQSAVLFGYDSDGRPEWTLGSGAIGEHSSEFALTRLSKGSGPRDAYQRPQEAEAIGALLIAPKDPSNANVWIAYLDNTSGDLNLRAVRMQRFSFGGSPAQAWIGGWLLVLPSDDPTRPESIELEFDQLRPDPGGFVLSDRLLGAELLCVQDAGGSERLPILCRLSLPDAEIELDFEQIGLRKLEGRDGEGRRLRLISLDAG